jgi:hypothetical protein
LPERNHRTKRAHWPRCNQFCALAAEIDHKIGDIVLANKALSDDASRFVGRERPSQTVPVPTWTQRTDWPAVISVSATIASANPLSPCSGASMPQSRVISPATLASRSGSSRTRGVQAGRQTVAGTQTDLQEFLSRPSVNPNAPIEERPP